MNDVRWLVCRPDGDDGGVWSVAAKMTR
jgi:hypothetical protein